MISSLHSSPAALIVGHPGHELRLFHWLETARPVVFVLTDGSGSGSARVEATRRILSATGSSAGSVMGDFADHEMYRAVLEGDVTRVAEATLRIAEELAARNVTAVVADMFEFYNPTHDLCAVVANLAAAHASAMTRRTIARYDFAVIGTPPGDGEVLELDDAAVERKVAAAAAIEELKPEVDHLLDRIGIDALRREVLRPLATSNELPRPTAKPFYETHGEERVAAGRYSTVLRYDQHFAPFVERLVAEVGLATSRSGLHAYRS
jgi:hypothetical protein